MKKALALILILTMFLGAVPGAHAEATFRDWCYGALSQAARDLGLEYDEDDMKTDFKYSIVMFDIENERVFASDSSFSGTIDGIDEVDSLSLLYAFLRAYDTLSQSTIAGCEDFSYILVIDSSDYDEGVLVIDGDNREEAASALEELLVELGVDEDDPVFTREYADALFPVRRSSGMIRLGGKGGSGCPSAYGVMSWYGVNLTLTGVSEPSREELEDLWDEFGAGAEYITLTFESPDGDILLDDTDYFAPMIQLCDEFGNLIEYSQCARYLSNLQRGHSDDEYCSAFDLIFALPDGARPEDFLLFVPGEDDCTLYTYGAAFPAPDRRMSWEGCTFWVAAYNGGASMDPEDFEELARDEKFLEVGLCACSLNLFPSTVKPTDICLENARGYEFDPSNSVHYESEVVKVDAGKYYTWLHLVYVVPARSDEADYSIYVEGDEDLAMPVVVE